MQIKAVLFDMFDTLVLINGNYEFYNHAVVRMHNYIASHGVNVAFEPFREAYIKARDELYANADVNLEEPHFNIRIKNALQLLGHNIDDRDPVVTGATWEFCQEFLNNVKIDDNTKPVLQNLQGNYRLGIISNFAIPEGVYSVLKTNGINRMFETVVVSGEVNRRKPSPDIFQNTLNSLGLSAREAVFVGDTADADVAGAHSVGMKAVYIKRRFEETLEKFKPDLIIESLAELPSALKSF